MQTLDTECIKKLHEAERFKSKFGMYRFFFIVYKLTKQREALSYLISFFFVGRLEEIPFCTILKIFCILRGWGVQCP